MYMDTESTKTYPSRFAAGWQKLKKKHGEKSTEKVQFSRVGSWVHSHVLRMHRARWSCLYLYPLGHARAHVSQPPHSGVVVIAAERQIHDI